MSQWGKVAVLMGGASAEREVSLMSGGNVLEALRSQNIDAHMFDPAERNIWTLRDEGFERAFLMLHGRGGEDGVIQGALETLKIPYTGSGVMASALAMDKWRTKMIWRTSGIPTPRYLIVDRYSDWSMVIETLGLPFMLKAAHEGSSIGIAKIGHADISKIIETFSEVAKYDELILAEEFIAGEELTATILDDVALPLVRIAAPEGNYDFEHKYFSDDTCYFCPSGIETDLEEKIREDALWAFNIIGCRTWGRLDVILREDGTWSFLEINTVPGMTAHSLVPMAARAAGITFERLCLMILEGAHVA
ncbi:MAG: D-alanine--D-alanine ligase [Burkholderiales bacterium]|jgi:D-alanine-D-alanine ligase|nr:D-alanine--D-alanine ligase [Burkholderiales bacterium]